MPDRPNFILIFPDQWRSDCLSSLGHPVLDTPFLDEMAGEGVTFTAAYAACPSCIAARACLATGQTPHTAGRIGYRDRVPWRYPVTMMSCLRDAGYQTMNVGKTHFYPKRVTLGFEQLSLYDPQNFGDGLQSDYHMWLEKETNGEIRDTTQEINSNAWVVHPWQHDEYLHPNSWTITEAERLLEMRDPTRPFFLQVGFHRPHPPLDPPMAYWNRYKDREIPPAPVGEWAADFDYPVTQSDTTGGHLSGRLVADARRAYYAQCAHLDYQIGRLMYFMNQRGLAANTWLIFMADHGELHGDNYQYRKATAYEGSAKLPFIVRAPRALECPRNIRCDEPTTHMDIMPTLLDIAGAPIPASVEGDSLVPLIHGDEAPQWREFVHGEHNGFLNHQFVTDGKRKFVWDTFTGREQYFDLSADPYETVDLIADASRADEIQLWRRRLIDVLVERPEDGLTDGERLIPGTKLPAVRPELLSD